MALMLVAVDCLAEYLFLPAEEPLLGVLLSDTNWFILKLEPSIECGGNIVTLP